MTTINLAHLLELQLQMVSTSMYGLEQIMKEEMQEVNPLFVEAREQVQQAVVKLQQLTRR